MQNHTERINEIVDQAYQGELDWVNDYLTDTPLHENTLADIEKKKNITRANIVSLMLDVRYEKGSDERI